MVVNIADALTRQFSSNLHCYGGALFENRNNDNTSDGAADLG